MRILLENLGWVSAFSTRDAVDRAYLDKYNTLGAIKYARDLGSRKSRATTLELKPLASIRI